MSWAAAAVIYIGLTASRLSRLGQPVVLRADAGAERRRGDRSAPNNKIVYQYLRGERCPVEGRRGKYNVDLTGAVHALPGGAMARRWLRSLLWELLDNSITLDRLASIRLTIESAPQNAFLRGYIELWIRYRLLTLTGSREVDLQELAHAIDACHDELRKTDPVFNHIYHPLLRYLELAAPQLPLAWSHSSPSHSEIATSAAAISLDAAFRREERRRYLQNCRFDNGVNRYLMSDKRRMPDHRFLATFRAKWNRFLAFEEMVASLDWWLKVEKGLPARGIGWEALYEAWSIRRPDINSDTQTTRARARCTTETFRNGLLRHR